MTSDEVQLIQQLIKSEFAQRDQKLAEGNRRFAMIEDRLNTIDNRVSGIESNMNEQHRQTPLCVLAKRSPGAQRVVIRPSFACPIQHQTGPSK